MLMLKINSIVDGRRRMVGIADAPYTVAAGTRQVIVLRLTHRGMRALRHTPGHRHRAQIIATVAGEKSAIRKIRLELA